MATLLYLHGFLSSPQSMKAQKTRTWLAGNRPDIDFMCPQLTPYPRECARKLMKTLDSIAKPVYLIGSSMGGFWATWLVETLRLKAVMINPAVDVLNLMPNYINRDLINYYNLEKYHLTHQHLQQLKQYTFERLTHTENYWILLQTGDETLDYQLAINKYQGCRCTIEPGGDHSFQGFEHYLKQILDFYETA